MYEKATPLGLYCSEHGLQFVSEEEYSKEVTVCSVVGCNLTAQADLSLSYAANVTGCSYCNTSPVKVPFLYDEKLGKVFCHKPCWNCWRRKCVFKGCPCKADYALYLIIDQPEGKEEYVIPTVFCLLHTERLPKKPDDSIYDYVVETMRQSGRLPPERHRCFLETRKML